MGDWKRSAVHLWNRYKRGIVGTLVVLLLVGSFAAGYVNGSGSEADLGAVETAASEAGRKEGFEKGEKAGYARGLREARSRSYRSFYVAAYREAYSHEFELAGLDPPAHIRVPESQ